MSVTAAGSAEVKTFAFSAATATATVGETFTAPTLTNDYGTTVTYESNNTGVATVGTDGTVTLVAAGTAIITATDGTHTASYTLTVKAAASVIEGLSAIEYPTSGTTDYTVKLSGAVVTYVNGQNAYIEDATGGALIYGVSGLKAGDKITGNVAVTATLYGSTKELTAFDTSSATVESNATIPETELTAAAVAANIDRYENCRVKVVDATVTSGFSSRKATIEQTVDGTTTSLGIYGKQSSVTLPLEEGTTVDVVGYPGTYNSNVQLNVWEISDVTVKTATQKFEFSAATATATVGETFTAPTLTNDYSTTVTYTSSDTGVATVAADGTVTLVAAGTATITATDGTHTATYTLTVTKKSEETGDNTVFFHETFDGLTGTSNNTGGNDGSWSGNVGTGSNESLKEAGWTVNSFVYGADKCLKFGKSSNGLGSATTPAISLNGASAYLSFYAGAWNTSSEVSTIIVSVTGGTIDGSSSVTINLTKAAWTFYKYPITGTGDVTITIAATTKNKNRFFLDDVMVQSAEPLPLPIRTTEGFATFYTDKNFTMPEGLKGTAVNYDATASALTMDWEYAAGSEVPANTPLLLSNDGVGGNNYTATPLATTTATQPASNCLYGTLENSTPTDDGNYFYKLTYSMEDGVKTLGFFWDNETGVPFENQAGKAYLKLAKTSSLSAPRGFNLLTGSSVTGITPATALSADGQSAAVYTLGGVRVNPAAGKLPQGLYIVNGKKVLVK